MEKIKNALKWIGENLVLLLVGAVGLLVYYISLKNKSINALKAEIDLTKTQKDADALETHIKSKLQDSTLLKKEVDELNKTLVQLEEKRNSLPEGPRDPKDVEDYWKKN